MAGYKLGGVHEVRGGSQRHRLPSSALRSSNAAKRVPSRMGDASPRSHTVDDDSSLPGSLQVVVRRQREIAPLLITTMSHLTVGDLKVAIFKEGGVPPEEQRLYAQSRRLNDDQQLEDCGPIGASPPSGRLEVQLVPALGHKAARGVSAIPARRGFHMVPGHIMWRPSKHSILTPRDIHEFHGYGDDGIDRSLPPLPAPPPGVVSLSLTL
eukprot:TRINITY_DN3014_c0_g1_i1.p1 TRINITY_DN3014_c0_g1~~TRINITY_DN3014_c0_g1_i1.p1  ORF type:complete len:210 (+),score=31.83 TRINITY_DN3014_c0_g1_i1:162-791(+)